MFGISKIGEPEIIGFELFAKSAENAREILCEEVKYGLRPSGKYTISETERSGYYKVTRKPVRRGRRSKILVGKEVLKF